MLLKTVCHYWTWNGSVCHLCLNMHFPSCLEKDRRRNDVMAFFVMAWLQRSAQRTGGETTVLYRPDTCLKFLIYITTLTKFSTVHLNNEHELSLKNSPVNSEVY